MTNKCSHARISPELTHDFEKEKGEMMIGKIPYVCLYRSYREELEELTDEEVGRLIRCLLTYLEGQPLPTLPGNERFLWPRLRSQHDRDAEHYESTCENRSKSALKRWSKDANGSKGVQVVHLHANASNGMQKVNLHAKDAKEKEIEKEKEIDKEKDSLYMDQREERFSPPLLSDVLAACEQEGLTHVDGDYFWNYYAATGWKCGDKPMFDWKAMLRLWEKRAIKEQPVTAEYGGAYGQIL